MASVAHRGKEINQGFGNVSGMPPRRPTSTSRILGSSAAPRRPDDAAPAVRARRVPVRVLAGFFWQLSVLVSSGVSLLRSLEVLREGESLAGFAEVIARLECDIASGQRLSVAMSAYPSIFDGIVRGLVEVGEKVGLARPLALTARLLEQQGEMQARIAAALRYPVLVIVCALLMTFALFRWVLPGLLEIPPQGTALPWVSRVAARLTWAAGSPMVMVTVIVLAWGLGRWLRAWAREPAVAVRIDAWLMRLPGLGSLISHVAQIQLCRTLSIQLACGVGLMGAIETSRSACFSGSWRDHLRAVNARIARGELLAEAFSASVPPHAGLMVAMVALGDESGDHAFPLERAATVLEEDFNLRLGTVMDVVTPLLLAAAGAMTLVALLAALWPLQQMISGL